MTDPAKCEHKGPHLGNPCQYVSRPDPIKCTCSCTTGSSLHDDWCALPHQDPDLAKASDLADTIEFNYFQPEGWIGPDKDAIVKIISDALRRGGR